MAYVNPACTGRVIIFSMVQYFRLVSNFTELHTLPLATRSYATLLIYKTVLYDVVMCTVQIMHSY